MTAVHTQHPDVAVIGAGVIGLATAWEATRAGLSVTVLEQFQPGAGTTGVAAGMLAPVAEAAFGERALLDLNLASAGLYPDWIDELREAAGGPDPGYRQCGTLLVARDADQAAALERERAFREAEGLAVDPILPSQARRREPALAPAIRSALHVPGDHAIDPVTLVGALVAAIERAGGHVRSQARVTGVTTSADRISGVKLTGGETVSAGHVVAATGWGGGELEGLDPAARVPLRPVKGQLLHLRDPAGPGLLGCVLRSEEAYLVPRGDGRYVLGATMEERGADTTVTAGAAFELLREAIELVPGLMELEVEGMRAGLRPATPDNGPAIGPGAVEGLSWATGHYRHGVLLAPITGHAVVAGITGAEPPETAPPFAPARFAAQAVLEPGVPA